MTTLLLTRKELDYVFAQRAEKFRPNKFRTILPIISSVPAWAEEVVIEKVTMYGDVKPMQRGGSDVDLNRPTIDRDQNRIRLVSFGAEYGYKYLEIERARQTGVNLPSKMAEANQTKCEQIFDEIACTGNGATTWWPSLGGLTTNTSAVSAKQTASANWTSTVDSDVILGELHALVNAVAENSLENFVGNTVVLPLASYHFIATERLGDGTDKTILTAFREQNPYVQRVLAWNRLATAGTGGIKRAVAFDAVAPEGPKMFISQELTDMPQVTEKFGVAIGQEAVTAGCIIENYTTVQYLDGI